MIFKVAYKNKDRISIKVTDSKGKDIWMGCSDNVYNWCKKSFKDGDEVDVTYTENHGQYTATRVVKKGYNNAPPSGNDTAKNVKHEGKPDTGGISFNYPREYMKSKNPEESRQIRALSILSSVCQAMQGLAGHLDPNNVGDVIETLYDRFDKKLP